MESNRQAGVELNALVHLKLFGKSARPEWCPQYSTDWNNMRLVVEEMQRRGLFISIHAIEGDVSTWAVKFKGADMAYSSELPHAVCIAALAALKALEADTHES